MGIPIIRPDDYFAEMMKTDEHMQKVCFNFHVTPIHFPFQSYIAYLYEFFAGETFLARKTSGS